MRRGLIVVLALIISVAIFVVVFNLLGIGLAQPSRPTLEVKLTDMMTGRDYRVESGTLTLIDPGVEFEPPISKVAFCYRIQSSAPFTVTYNWLYGNDVVLQRRSVVKSGINCTTMQRNTSQNFPEGAYQIVILVEDGAPLASMSFVIRTVRQNG